MKNIKALARKIAEASNYEKEFLILEKIYNGSFENYKHFLEWILINASFSLDEVEDVRGNFAYSFDKNKDFFTQWLENEAFNLGRESLLSFLEKDLKISFDMFLNSKKEVKEEIVRAFCYSTCCALFDCFNENAELKGFLE